MGTVRDTYSVVMLRTVYAIAHTMPCDTEIDPSLLKPIGVKPPACIVSGVGVVRACRGRHYGSILVDRICREADNEGVTLLLSVQPDWDSPLQEEALIAFYERHGFSNNTDFHLMIRSPLCPPSMIPPDHKSATPQSV